MRRVLRKTPKTGRRGKLQTVSVPEESPAPGTSRAPQAAGIAKLLEGARARREGKRILLLGATRKGKTTFARKLLDGLIAQEVASIVLIHDQKHADHQQFDGSPASSIDQVRALIAAGVQRRIVCRAPITVEEMSAIGRDLVEAGVPAAVMVDEMMPGLRVNEDTGEPMERVWSGPTPIWILLQGGGLGASIIVNAQLPKMVPGTMVDNAEACIVFNLGGRSLEYSADLHLIPRAAIPTVLRLVEGEYCIFKADQEWDGTIYGPG